MGWRTGRPEHCDGAWTGDVEIQLPETSAALPSTLDLHVRPDLVEVSYDGRNVATFPRRALSAWLRAPDGELASDEISWRVAAGRRARITVSVNGGHGHVVRSPQLRHLQTVL